jgi:hypothetical protein
VTGLPRVTLAVPCRTDEPGLDRTLAVAWERLREAGALPADTLVCINGARGGESQARADIERHAGRTGMPFVVYDVDMGAPVRAEKGATVAALMTARAGKAIAWNWLRRCARTEVVVFLDADVDVTTGAIARLQAALATSPDAVIATPKTSCAARATAFERIMAAPYGLDFPNLSGQLYAARTVGLPGAMPEDLIEPERWLELVIGRERIVREPEARVIVRLPATVADFYRQRIRIEMGKVQIDREYPELVRRGNPQPRLRAALATLPVGELARLAIYGALRESAHLLAWWRYRRRRTDAVWIQAASTKAWGG